MSGVPLYFPDGVPEPVRRIIDPDTVHKKVQQGLVEIEAEWKKLAPKADAVTQGIRPWWKRLFGGSLEVDHKYVMSMLYQPMSKWPRGLSKSEKGALDVVRRLRQLGPTPLVPWVDWGHEQAPTDDEMTKAFKLLAKDAIPVARAAQGDFHDTLDEVGADIEPLCLSLYNEECTRGEGVEIALADVGILVKVGRFPKMSPEGARILQALWSAVYGSA